MNDPTPLTFESTGNPPLDAILGGGIPSRSVVVIAGEPGSGKTILTLQMLFTAARAGKTCLYFTTLSEPAIKVVRYMQMFDFFDLAQVGKKVILADLGAAVRAGPEAVLSAIEARVVEHEPAIIVIDSFRVVAEVLKSQGHTASRTFTYDLAVQTSGWGATTLLVGEYQSPELADFPEFAVADGIIRMGSERQELTSVREIEILKMRGTAYVSGRHFFEIHQAGVSFYPRVRAPEEAYRGSPDDYQRRAGTGVAGLDQLLDGGLPVNSATVIQGGTGTGKTLLSLCFLVEGARVGERGVLFTLEESPEQLRAIARQLGWDLEALEKKELLRIVYSSPVELSTDRFFADARRTVQQLGARRAVFDSLTTMGLGVPSERRFKELVYAISKHMRAVGVTLVMTAESRQLLGASELSGDGVSFIADNLVQLRYVEMGARLERAISVLKARGIRHDSELREMRVGKGGPVVLEQRFKDLRRVLSGFPVKPSEQP